MKQWKSALSCLLVCCMVISMLPVTARAATSGDCGDNATWTLDDNGTMTISGDGAMEDYSAGSAPWYSYQTTITSVTINTGVTSIGDYAFYYCTSLTSINIPDSVISIGESAFSGCYNLTSVDIPNSVTSIGGGAFDSCSSLTSINIPNSVTSIGGGAFSLCSGLTSINIPDSVTSIGSYAFHCCYSLTSVTIPASVTSIVDGAFSYCSSLTSVTIPASVTSIGEYAFYNCSDLTDVYYGGTKEQWQTISIGESNDPLTGATIHCSTDETLSGTCGDNLTWTLVDGVLTISGSGAMTDYSYQSDDSLSPPWSSNVSDIKSVIISDGVTHIGGCSFEMCDNLVSVTIPNSVTSIGDETFDQCTSLTSITIPDSVTSIGEAAFTGCTGLTSINIPDGVTSIDLRAFYGCTSLTSVTLPDSVTVIDHGAFSGCTGLTDFTVPDNVSIIGEQAFDGCTSLSSITIPVSVTSIDDEAFYNCPALTDVYYGGSESEWAKITIGASNEPLTSATIHYNSTGPGKTSISLTAGSSTIATGTADPSVAITSSAPLNANAVTNLDNYTVDAGTTGLTLASVTLGSSGVASYATGDTQFTLSFSGTAQAGTLTVTVNNAIFDQTAGGTGFDYDGTYSVKLTVSTASGGGSSSGSPDVITSGDGASDNSDTEEETDEIIPAVPETPISPEVPIVESPLQSIVKQDTDETLVNWVDRIDVPEYAADLYDVMVSGSKEGSSLSDCFVHDDYYIINPDAMAGMPELWENVDIEEVAFDLSAFYADGSGALGSAVFSEDSFLSVGTSSSDKAVNYPALVTGDVVQTASFNGVFVTKVTKGDTWEQDKIDTASYIATIYHAFDRDHPEVFWLSGSSKARIVTVENVAYFFLVLADEGGFTMRAPDWTSAGAVAAGIQRRDNAITTILSNITGTTDYEKVAQLNRWLTQHNEYNRSADLAAIGNEPHECLSALEGREGTSGPVCEGYARAFKVLCDKLGIPCVLESGYARVTADSAGEAHMWNLVQIGENWYGVDVTWNDPIVVSKTGALSGYENEDYLLAGSNTEINGLTFAYSHPATNQAAEGGVMFNNGPVISLGSYGAAVTVSPFTDVSENAYYYDAILWAVEKGITTGKTATTFDPDASCTRAQMVTFLWRYAGEPEPESNVNPFIDISESAYYYKAVLWAVEQGVTNGTSATEFSPDKTVTRAQTVTFLYRYADEPTVSNSNSFTDVESGKYFTNAIQWAVANDITTGYADSTFRPYNNCTRAQIVTFMYRDFAN